MSRNLKLIAIVLSLALVLTVVLLVGSMDSHHTNIAYLLWKRQLYPYDSSRCLRYLNVDVPFRMSLVGKTITEAKSWFPDLTAVASPFDVTPDTKLPSADTAYYWLDGKGWALEVKSGRITDVILVKP